MEQFVGEATSVLVEDDGEVWERRKNLQVKKIYSLVENTIEN